MSEFVKKIEAYFKNTPKEKLNADYKRIHSEYGHGVEISEYMNSMEQCEYTLNDDYTITYSGCLSSHPFVVDVEFYLAA